MYDEAFPLFTMSEVEKGGLGFSTKDILFYLFLFSSFSFVHKLLFSLLHPFFFFFLTLRRHWSSWGNQWNLSGAHSTRDILPRCH